MNSYKNAMDKIVLSAEEKEKIIKTALLKTKTRKRPVYKYAVNIAAGVIICLISIPATEFFLKPAPDYVPVITLTPSPTETPETDFPLVRETEAPDGTNTTGEKVQTEKTSTPRRTVNQPETQAQKQNTLPIAASEQKSDTYEAAAEDTANEPAAEVSLAATTTTEDLAEDFSGSNMLRSASPKSAGSGSAPAAPYISGYTAQETDLISETLIQIVYANGSSYLIYRTRPGSGDCSGDYNDYANVEETVCGGKNVTVKTDETFGTLAIWENGGASFSLHTDAILTKTEVSGLLSDI